MSLCPCFKEVEEKLKPHGLRLANKVFCMAGLSLDLNFHIPLERIDGARMKRKDPKSLRVSHCPFCGKPVKLKKSEEDEATTGQDESHMRVPLSESEEGDL